MTRRPALRLETRAMRAERLAEETAQAPDPVLEACRRAVRRGLSAYAGAARQCPIKTCRRARVCASDSFACLVGRRRPVLPAIDEDIAVDQLYEFVIETPQDRQ